MAYPPIDFTRYRDLRTILKGNNSYGTVPNSDNLPDSPMPNLYSPIHRNILPIQPSYISRFNTTPTIGKPDYSSVKGNIPSKGNLLSTNIDPLSIPATKLPPAGAGTPPPKDNSYNSLIRSTAGLAGNLIAANRLSTEIPTEMVTNRPFVYKNRSGMLRDRNMGNFRNFINNRTGLPVNANQAYASTLNANNQVSLVGAESEDKAVETYTNRNMQIDATNADAYNRNLYINNMLKNNKVTQQGNAFTNYLMNLDTAELQRSQEAKDNKTLEIMSKSLAYGRNDAFGEYVKKLIEGYTKNEKK